MEKIDVGIARQLLRNYVSVATDTDTIEGVVFSVQSVSMLYTEDQLDPCGGGYSTVAL